VHAHLVSTGTNGGVGDDAGEKRGRGRAAASARIPAKPGSMWGHGGR
jgi:hypothetical protein